MICDGYDGWFDYRDFYLHIIQNLKDGSHLVEVGCWMGKSGGYLVEKSKELGKNFQIDFVDTWDGDVNVPYQIDLIRQNGKDHIYEIFKSNIFNIDYEFSGKIIRMDSSKASGLYDDNSLDFVFIDADHSYEKVLEDIKAWLPKIKIGGILAGHDYDFEGVKKAVWETFGDLPEHKGHVWCFEKGK